MFINRILTLFRQSSHKKRIRLTSDFMSDIDWFITFLPHFNGVTFFKKAPILGNHTLFLDASLTGLGVSGPIEFTVPLYLKFQTLS